MTIKSVSLESVVEDIGLHESCKLLNARYPTLNSRLRSKKGWRVGEFVDGKKKVKRCFLPDPI